MEGKPTFKEFREKVPIIQVAESLGYKVDLRKGKRRLEYKHPDGDTVIISNPNNSARQLYFNRDGSIDRGSVIDFVANRLTRFNEHYQSVTEGVNKVLSRFANEPQTFKPSFPTPKPKAFSQSRYESLPLTVGKLHYLTKARGLYRETVKLFMPYIRLVKDSQKEPAKAYANIAFPLTKPGSTAIVGYDLRNYGFKSVAAGSDRQQGSWIADFAGDPARTRNVFFGENPIDVMSFYQLHKHRIDINSSVFIAFGGGIAKAQLQLALRHWPQAAKHSLFDNDYQGKVYDILLATAMSGKEYSFKKGNDSLLFKVNGKSFELATDRLSLSAFERQAGVRSGLHVHKAKGVKDFNDLLTPEVKKRVLS
ncbi:DUF3991 domain-containing protein [Pontibacter litorisediminis]|uniref:DUF3991 domain-containing protein n=1 Tax=Pontibacter litorisediminis TaxID=1846260 RepID=UPI0023EB2119|nr:DUF3991 domain-containing protein [Pontibacter litorisediminis]